MKPNEIRALVSGQMATLVGKVMTSVIPASGTQPADGVKTTPRNDGNNA